MMVMQKEQIDLNNGMEFSVIFSMTWLRYVSLWFQKVARGTHTGGTCSLIHTILAFFTILNKLYLQPNLKSTLLETNAKDVL